MTEEKLLSYPPTHTLHIQSFPSLLHFNRWLYSIPNAKNVVRFLDFSLILAVSSHSLWSVRGFSQF